MEMSPETVVFAFDLHEVVVTPNRVEMGLLMLTTKEGRRLCGTVLLKPKILVELIKTLFKFFSEDFVSKKGVVAEEVFFTVADQFPELAQQAEFFCQSS